MTRILITGGCGFIGSAFVRHVLRETDWEVVVLDRLGEASAQRRVAELMVEAGTRLHFIWHDLKASLVAHPDRITREEYDYVVHMAAGSHVDRSVRDPVGFVADNVAGTCNLLEWARRVHGLRKFLYFSTDEVFGACVNRDPFDEYDSLYPTNPYAASKAAAEMLCPAWANTYGMPITVTRCTNVIGPGQDSEKFIPNTIAKIARGEMVQIHSRDGVSSSRKYIDVRDVCRAVMVVLERGGVIAGRNTGFYNIGGGVDYQNHFVAAELGRLMAYRVRSELVEDPPNRPRPDMRYDVYAERLEDLGWCQRESLESTLADIVAKDFGPLGHGVQRDAATGYRESPDETPKVVGL